MPIIFVQNPAGEDQIKESVETIDIYVFDEETGLLSGIIRVDKSDILRGSFEVTDLPDGTYTFVAWGDSNSNISRSFAGVQMDDLESGETSAVRIGVTTIDNFYMMLDSRDLPASTEGDVEPSRNDFDDLFHAIATGVGIVGGETSVVTLSFTCNSSRLKIEVNGVEAMRAYGKAQAGDSGFARTAGTRAGGDVGEESGDDDLSVFVLAKNGRYNSRNITDDFAPMVRYSPQTQSYDSENNSMDVSIRTMRLDVVRHHVYPVELYIQDSEGRNLISAPIDILDAILRTKDDKGTLLYPDQAAIDREVEFDIKINATLENDTELKVVIIINGWEVVLIDDPELGGFDETR
jgi:hypothetical protein